MINELSFGSSGRKKLLEGVNKIANAVKVTLGARGRNVIIERIGYTPQLTKDGVTVAKSINLEDPIERMGASLIKEVANKTVEMSGDGTTSASVLAQAIICGGIKAVESGSNPMDLKRGIDKATGEVVKYLKSISTPIKDNNDLRQIASISANNDTEIGELIADAVEKIGRDGEVKVIEAKGYETTVNIETGVKVERGYISHFFVTDKEKMKCEFENPCILLYEKRISVMRDLLPILEQVTKNGRPLFVICEDLDGEALAVVVHNNLQKNIKFCAVRAPEFGDNQKEVMEDIAIMTGGNYITEAKAQKLETTIYATLGSADTVTVTKDNCLIVGGKGNAAAIETRCNQIKTELENAKSPYDIARLKTRLAKLKNGVAVLSIGGITETEISEKADRIEDALCATRSAVEEGFVSGGGTSYLSATKNMDIVAENEDEKIGIAILKKALEAPFRQILDNGGIEASAYIKEILEAEYGVGYNIKTNKVENLLESGVIDPTKVVRVALENASSIAGMFLTTEAIVSQVKTENK